MLREDLPTRGDPSDQGARKRVLAVASRILDESGIEGLTIRRLARESGFTPPAIYALFGDKAGLVVALIDCGFRDLLDRVRNIERSDDAMLYARRAFRELVQFGRDHHWHFQLIETTVPQHSMLESVQEARVVLSAPLAEMAASGAIQNLDIELVRQTLWCLVHGLISLPPSRPDVAWRDQLSEWAFETMLTGLRHIDRPGEA